MTGMRSVGMVVGLLAAVVLTGCGPKGPAMVKVTGTLTLDGTPVDGAIVGFLPSDGTPVTATTDASGNFSLEAPVGKSDVTVVKSEVIGEIETSEEQTGGDVRTKALLPIRYTTPQGSGLSFDIQPGMGPIALELKSQ